MMKRLILVLLVLLILPFSLASLELFFSSPYESMLRSNDQVYFFPFFEGTFFVNEHTSITVFDRIEEISTKNVVVEITKTGFDPPYLIIEEGQEVIWRNERSDFEAIVVGLREITSMRSEIVEPGDQFSWIFSNTGDYTYIDAVFVGSVGKITVIEKQNLFKEN